MQTIKFPIHLQDFEKHPIDPKHVHLTFSNETGYDGTSFDCQFPTNVSAKVNLNLLCRLNVSTFLASQTATLRYIRISDTGSNFFTGSRPYLLNKLNEALTSHKLTNFAKLPSVNIVQTGKTDITAPIFAGGVHLKPTYFIGPSGHSIAKIHVSLMETESGVQWGTTSLIFRNTKDPYGGEIACDDWYNKTVNHATCVVRLNHVQKHHGGFPGGNSLTNGTYQLRYIHTADNAFNKWGSGFNENDPNATLAAINKRLPMGRKLKQLPHFQLVIDHNADTTPPVMHSMKISPTNLTATGGVVSVTVQIGDDRSGIKEDSIVVAFDNGIEVFGKHRLLPCQFNWFNPFGGNGEVYEQKEGQMEEDENDHEGRRIMFLTVTCKIKIPKGSASGNFSLSYVQMRDLAGNSFTACCSPPLPGSHCGCDVLEQLNSLLPPSQQFPALPSFDFVETGPVDTQAPILRGATLYPTTVTLSKKGEGPQVNITAHVTDNISGVVVNEVTMSFANGFHTIGCYSFKDYQGLAPHTNLKLKCSMHIWQGATAGTYKLHNLYMVDRVGNRRSIEGNATTVLNELNKLLPKGQKFAALPSVTVKPAM
eukprot:TRINITY_DN65928_c6_g1_i2.p1 TRINITY_DN65928_c6_g1~~TRINITY_DN65928_c6_g1_i2.p1  ORF type:complete len:641 (-),score=94.08 TRINITY_DN65928_c6_g1_i2:172-1950(-)